MDHQKSIQNSKTIKDNTASGVVNRYLAETDWRIRENSNMSFSLQGLNNHISSHVISRYWLSDIYPYDIGRAHLYGDIHIHDLGTLGSYCVGWDIKDFLLKGFDGVRGKVGSKPPKRFRVALLQVVNLLYTLQGESAGAQALSNIDTYLAPFIKNENLSYAEVRQNMQEFLYNMNVPTRVGFQTPFTNVTLDVVVPKHLAGMPAIIAGKPADFNLGDCQKEMDMFNRAFAEIMTEGDKNGRPFTFPIPTYNITEDFDWDNPVLDSVWEMTAKYGLPYFANYVNSGMDPSEATSMCCRLRIDHRELHRRGGGLFGANPLTGSIGVVTINLPRIAYLAKSENDFFDRLDEMMSISRRSLKIKRDLLEKLTNDGLYPYSKFYLQGVKDTRGAYWDNHFSTIGIIGMNDALWTMFGLTTADDEGIAFSKRVLEFMRDKISLYQEQDDFLYNIEATPAEGASFRLAKIDMDILSGMTPYSVSHGSDVPYYTNSTQLPVDSGLNLFEALDKQDELQSLYTGGTVFHVFLGERMPDVDSVKALVKNISERHIMPYFSITPTFSVCKNHGYISGRHNSCDKCGERTEIYSRVVGFIRPVEQWNDGKQEEFSARTTFEA